MKITIPGRLPGLNELLDAMNRNRYEYNRIKKEHSHAVGWLFKKIPPMDRINITITWIEPNRRRDKDNISSGGVKIILDALRDVGVITNDGWKQIEKITHQFDVDKHNPRVEIEIEEAL